MTRRYLLSMLKSSLFSLNHKYIWNACLLKFDVPFLQQNQTVFLLTGDKVGNRRGLFMSIYLLLIGI